MEGSEIENQFVSVVSGFCDLKYIQNWHYLSEHQWISENVSVKVLNCDKNHLQKLINLIFLFPENILDQGLV